MRVRMLSAFTLATMAIALPAVAQSGEGQVSVVHGVPGLTVDVYVDDQLTLEDFAYQTVTAPVTLPAGDHRVAIFAADADPATTEPALSDTVTLPAGANASIAAHLAADGSPTLSVFVNDVAAVAAGESRVAVRHAAAAPAVDVTANDAVTIASGLANGSEAVAAVPAATYTVDVTLSDGGDAVFSDVALPLQEGTLTTVYAVGNADAGYELVTNTFTGLHSPPSGVPAGDAGLADTGAPLWLIAVLLLGATLVAAPVAVAIRRR